MSYDALPFDRHQIKSTLEIVRRGEIILDHFSEEGMDEPTQVLVTYGEDEAGFMLRRYIALPHASEPMWTLDKFTIINDEPVRENFWDHRQTMIEIAQDEDMV